MAEQAQEGRVPVLGFMHVRKEDLRVGSARDLNPAFASFDVVHRRDYKQIAQQLEQAEQRIEELERLERDYKRVHSDAEFHCQRADIAERALAEILNCTSDEHDPNRWHVKKGKGPQFSSAVREARDLLRQDSATAEATQETVVREDSDEG